MLSVYLIAIGQIPFCRMKTNRDITVDCSLVLIYTVIQMYNYSLYNIIV